MDEAAPGAEHRVVAPARCDPAGRLGPTRRQAGGDDWRWSSRGLYVPAHVELTPEQRVVEAGVLVPRYAAVTGWASMCWHGARWFTGTGADDTLRDVPIASPGNGIRTQPGLHLCGERFRPWDGMVVDGIRVTRPVAATCFEMRYAPSVREARVVLAMAAFDDLVSGEEAAEHADARASWTGIERCRRALGVDENFWSPQEVRMEDAWVAAGFPPPLPNRPVFDLGGRHLGTPDLIDPTTGVLGQYDGAVHLAGAQRAKDVRRDEAYRDHGLEGVTAMAGDLGSDAWTTRLRQAYARATRVPVADRRWTLDLSPWWVPTFTVEQRRALDQEQRTRLLRYRAA